MRGSRQSGPRAACGPATRRHRWWLGLLAIVVVPISLALLGYVALVAPWINWTGQGLLPFDGAVWRSAEPVGSESPRGAMVRDLMRHRLHTGMDRREVEQLLDAPGATHPDPTKYVYNLGSKVNGVRFMDDYTLDIHFSPAGRVTNVALVQH